MGLLPSEIYDRQENYMLDYHCVGGWNTGNPVSLRLLRVMDLLLRRVSVDEKHAEDLEQTSHVSPGRINWKFEPRGKN